MSFRIEEKILMEKTEILRFLNQYYNNLKKIYDTRTINSIYFDDKYLSSHIDGEEGSIPRKKTRIRFYNHINTNETFFLEKKISSIEGRYKTSKEIDSDKFTKMTKNGVICNMYGQIFPKAIVSYKRSYFKLKDVRLTIDEDIKYSKYQMNNKVKYLYDDICVIELKADYLTNIDYLKNLIPVQRSRFSKYSRACNMLELN